MKKTKMRTKRQLFMDLKRPDAVFHPKAVSVQDTINVLQISPNGIFRVAEEKWSKCYLLSDVNYTPKTFDEQLAFFYEWCKNINSFDVAVKFCVFNKSRNMELIREKILYQHKDDPYDWLRDAYNDIIEVKILGGKQGIEQVKLFTVTVEKKDYEEAKSHLSALEGSLMNNFASIGSRLVPLNANERIEFLFNFYRIGDERLYQLDVEQEIINGRDWKNEIACGYIDFDSSIEEFSTERVVGCGLYIDPQSYPTSLSDTFFTDLANIPVTSLVTVDYQPIPQDLTIKTLEDKLMGIESTITKQQQKRNRQNNYSSDISYKIRREKEEVEKMLDELRENDQKMFWVGVTTVLLAEDEEKLKNAKRMVNQIAEKNSCKMEPYYLRQREALNTALPIGCRQVDGMRAMFTSSAGALMPFNVVELQQLNHPFYYGINQISKEPILANRKTLVNGNGFVFGVPGGGKSFTGCKMEIGSVYLNTEDDIIFVDPTLEYFDVAKAYGGVVINMATYTKQHMNPLDVDLEELSIHDTDGQIADKGEFMLGICEQAMEGELKPEHKSIIDRCIRLLFFDIASQPPAERKQPTMKDFIDIVRKQPEEEYAKKIVLAMEIFVDGGLNIFNHETDIDVENRVVVYGLRDMGEHLAGMAMLVMLENIKQRIIMNAKKGRATWLYVDEFHEVLKSRYSRDYFISLWKKVRKLGGLCTGITQNVVEVLKDPMTSTLVSNSEYTLLLRQAAPDIESLNKAFKGISDAQLKYVSNASPGTGLIRFGEIIIPFDNKIARDNPVYDVYNTNLHEKVAKKKAERHT